MWNPGDDKKTAGMMISAVVIVCLALIAVIFAFVMLQRRHESEISAASDTEGQTEITIEIGKAKKKRKLPERTETKQRKMLRTVRERARVCIWLKEKIPDLILTKRLTIWHIRTVSAIPGKNCPGWTPMACALQEMRFMPAMAGCSMIRIFRTILTGRIGMWRRHPPQISTNLSSMMWSCIMWN